MTPLSRADPALSPPLPPAAPGVAPPAAAAHTPPSSPRYCVGCGQRFVTKTKGGRKRQLGDQHGGGGSLSDLTAAADSIDGGGARPVYRKRGAGWGNKLCPACGQANTMGRLSCVLCGAKFSVRVT